MLAAGRCRVVMPAVVALGEDGNRIDVPEFQCALELRGIEGRADARDLLGGVEIKMNVTIAHV
jgi:hypothetical protein